MLYPTPRMPRLPELPVTDPRIYSTATGPEKPTIQRPDEAMRELRGDMAPPRAFPLSCTSGTLRINPKEFALMSNRKTAAPIWSRKFTEFEPLATGVSHYHRVILRRTDDPSNVAGLDQIFGDQHNSLEAALLLSRHCINKHDDLTSFLALAALQFWACVNERFMLCRHRPYSEAYPRTVMLLVPQMDFEITKGEAIMTLVEDLTPTMDMVALARRHTITDFVFVVLTMIRRYVIRHEVQSDEKDVINPRKFVINKLSKSHDLFLTSRKFSEVSIDGLLETVNSLLTAAYGDDKRFRFGTKRIRWLPQNYHTNLKFIPPKSARFALPALYYHAWFSPYHSLLQVFEPITQRKLVPKGNERLFEELLAQLAFISPNNRHGVWNTAFGEILTGVIEDAKKRQEPTRELQEDKRNHQFFVRMLHCYQYVNFAFRLYSICPSLDNTRIFYVAPWGEVDTNAAMDEASFMAFDAHVARAICADGEKLPLLWPDAKFDRIQPHRQRGLLLRQGTDSPTAHGTLYPISAEWSYLGFDAQPLTPRGQELLLALTEPVTENSVVMIFQGLHWLLRDEPDIWCNFCELLELPPAAACELLQRQYREYVGECALQAEESFRILGSEFQAALTRLGQSSGRRDYLVLDAELVSTHYTPTAHALFCEAVGLSKPVPSGLGELLCAHFNSLDVSGVDEQLEWPTGAFKECMTRFRRTLVYPVGEWLRARYPPYHVKLPRGVCWTDPVAVPEASQGFDSIKTHMLTASLRLMGPSKRRALNSLTVQDVNARPVTEEERRLAAYLEVALPQETKLEPIKQAMRNIRNAPYSSVTAERDGWSPSYLKCYLLLRGDCDTLNTIQASTIDAVYTELCLDPHPSNAGPSELAPRNRIPYYISELFRHLVKEFGPRQLAINSAFQQLADHLVMKSVHAYIQPSNNRMHKRSVPL